MVTEKGDRVGTFELHQCFDVLPTFRGRNVQLPTWKIRREDLSFGGCWGNFLRLFYCKYVQINAATCACACVCVRACTGTSQDDDDQLLRDDEEQTF